MSKNGTFKNGRSPRTAVKRKPQLRILHYSFVPKYLKNNSFERFAPTSLSTTDAFFPWGSLIYPFLYNLSIASQSRPFHALVAYWSCELVRYRSASTISSTLSLSYSIIALSFLHLERWNAKDLVGPFDITFLLIIQFPDGLYLCPELKTPHKPKGSSTIFATHCITALSLCSYIWLNPYRGKKGWRTFRITWLKIARSISNNPFYAFLFQLKKWW